LFMASISKIPSSQTKVVSLCCCRGFLFILAMLHANMVII
jgi:hypothetical protein